jgi:hypothetical protein
MAQLSTAAIECTATTECNSNDTTRRNYFLGFAAAGDSLAASFFRSRRFFHFWRIFIRMRRCLLLLRAKATPVGNNSD